MFHNFRNGRTKIPFKRASSLVPPRPLPCPSVCQNHGVALHSIIISERAIGGKEGRPHQTFSLPWSHPSRKFIFFFSSLGYHPLCAFAMLMRGRSSSWSAASIAFWGLTLLLSVDRSLFRCHGTDLGLHGRWPGFLDRALFRGLVLGCQVLARPPRLQGTKCTNTPSLFQLFFPF